MSIVAVIKAGVEAAWPFPVSKPFESVTWHDKEEPSEDREYLSNFMLENKVKVTHYTDYGMKFTVAYKKATEHKNCRMIEVSVAYCAPKDIFSKKVGVKRAIDNFIAGKTVLVPARTSKNDLDTAQNLRTMFAFC